MMIQIRSIADVPGRFLPIDGRAMITMLASITAIIWPNVVLEMTSHLYWTKPFPKTIADLWG